MITVTVCGATYTCAKAIQGDDYVRLVDESGQLVAAFEGVSDFTRFSIAGGSWTAADAEYNCRVALIGSDGVVRPSDFCRRQFLVDSRAFSGTIVLSNGIQFGTELPETGVEGQLFFKLN